METADSLVAYFHRHLVPLYAIFSNDGVDCCYMATAFILSAEDEWFLVTAGHVAEELSELLKSPDYEFRRAFLHDSGGIESIDRQPLPFDLDEDRFAVLGNEKSLDYAVAHLSPYYRNLLASNGVEPLTEDVWRYKPTDPEFYFLIGVPKQLIKTEWKDDLEKALDSIQVVTTMHWVSHEEQRPEGLNEINYPRWYGTIVTDEHVSDIKGMSGGPIFAFKRNDQGQLKYWLIGIQSSWNKKNKAIAACDPYPLGKFLAETIADLKETDSA